MTSESLVEAARQLAPEVSERALFSMGRWKTVGRMLLGLDPATFMY